MRPCDEHIKKILDLMQKMFNLADEGDAVREDTKCGVLCSILRDSAYNIRQLAEAEKEAHKKIRWWKEEKSEVKNANP